MSRLPAVRLALFAALSAAAAFLSPVAAQAVTTAPAAVAHASAASAGGILSWDFSNLTYPSLAGCQDEGNYLIGVPGTRILDYQCALNDPEAGVYNLWVLVNNDPCPTCIIGRSGTIAISGALSGQGLRPR